MDINANKHIKLFIDDSDDMEKMAKCCYALASTDRIRILKGIMYYPKSISTLSNETGIPISTVSRYAQDLAEAGLISITYQPGIKGHTKFCAQETLSCNFVFDAQLFSRPDYGQREFVTEMPIGMFSSCTVTPPCGMLGAVEPLAIKDNPAAFFSPQRMNAECIWFNTGMLGYTFPVPAEFMHERTMQSLSFSFEVCSEANNYNVNWPSDITVLINGVEVLTFTSPGDFGGTRGKFTPSYWPVTCTQYGLLKKIEITPLGTSLDGVSVGSEHTLDSLGIRGSDTVRFELGIKESAVHRGGINLFGKNFGDFNQAIIMTIK